MVRKQQDIDWWRDGLRDAQAMRVLTGIGLFVFGAMMVWQDDTWWHLRVGQYIWEQGGVPILDPFSYSLTFGAFWPNHEWLAQVLLYGTWSLGGMSLVNLGGGVVFCLTGLLVLGPERERNLIPLLLILPWLSAALSARPQIFSMLGLVLTIRLLQRDRAWWIPLVFLVWANLHGAVSLGGYTLVMACVAAAVLHRPALRTLVPVTFVAGAATLATPLRAHILVFPIESVQRLKQLDLTEWNAPGFEQLLHVYFWVLLAAFAVLLWQARARLHAWPAALPVALACAFVPLSIMSERNIPLFLLAAAIATPQLLRTAARPQTAIESVPMRKNLATVGLFGLFACAGLGWAFSQPLPRLEWDPMQPAAREAIAAAPQPTFNTYNTGGYLLWFLPERAVFIDSRQDPYPIELLQSTIAAQQSGAYEPLFARFGFRSAVMEPHWPLATRLLEAGWTETYRDERWLVLTRDNMEALAKLAQK